MEASRLFAFDLTQVVDFPLLSFGIPSAERGMSLGVCAALCRLAKWRGFFAFSVNWPGVSLAGMKNRANKP
jgi:hypothetical protein